MCSRAWIVPLQKESAIPTSKADLLRKLIRAYSQRDDREFRSIALKLISSERAAGHGKIADAIRDELGTLPETSSFMGRGQQVVDIARPRGELAGLLQSSHPSERLKDIVLKPASQKRMLRILKETRRRADLHSWGIKPNRKLLFYGPPGCGKTLAARVIAGELGLPLMTVRFEALFSRFLGETAGHLSLIFKEMPTRPAVYFFDEFDAIGRTRGESLEVGEVRRVVISFLQLMDADQSPGLIIAATNFEAALDNAVFRRFDQLLEFPIPDMEEIISLLQIRLARFDLKDEDYVGAARLLSGASFAEAARASDEALKSMVLDGRSQLRGTDLFAAASEVVDQRLLA